MPVLRFLLCFLFLTAWSWAQDTSPAYFFRGQPYRFQAVRVGEASAWRLDDPEVQKLVGATFARLQVSTTGKTLYVFLPGRESYWTEGLSVYTRAGQELPAPGQFFSQPAAMESAALLEALGLKAYPTEGGFQLVSLVTQIQPVAPDSAELRLQTSAPARYTSTEPELGVVRIEVSECAWDLPERRFRLGEAEVEVQGGDRADAPLVVLLRYLPFWTARVKTGLAREIVISPEPRHFNAPRETARLQSITPSPESGERDIEFAFDRPVQFFWAQVGSTLTLEFPACESSLTETRRLQGPSYPVSRYQVELEEGWAFEFFQRQERPNSLILKLGKQVTKAAEPSGTASMGGYASGGGTIVLDPGHGGGDPGCRNRALGVYEKDVTLDICLRLRQILQDRGWKVEMTRTTDRDVTYAGSPDLMELQARADVANKIGADLFVSIHCNASVSTASRGSSIYWWKAQDRALAECLDVLDSSLGFEQDGLIQNRFAVLRLTSMPAVLVETAFLTNPVEGRLLADPKIRQRIAELLADGLDRYWAQQKR